jgi:tRNA nucleotidyltransferase (CCA-adding enzyme)
MRSKLPQEVINIITKVSDAGFEIYVVGGAVRDLLMNKIVVDWDYTTNAKPQEILKLFKEAYYGNTFGTVGIPSKDPDLKPHEITTFRTEHGYSDSRRPDKIRWGSSLTQDLKRRDFTINAIALKIKGDDNVELIDPYNGQKDLKNKLIKTVGDPSERFSEDGLRLMRAIRLASQLGFTIEDQTLEAIKTNATLINKIAKERVRDELFKILLSPYPDEGILLLRNTGILELILPELEKTFGVDQRSPQRHHIYDVGTHLIKSLKACESQDPIVLLAVLIHDIGKPQTYKKQGNNVTTFYNHEIVSARIAKQIADRLRLSKRQKDKLWHLVRFHQFTVDENQTDSALRRFIRKVTPEFLDDMLELRRADRLGSGSRETSWRTEEFKKRLVEVQKQPFTVHDLKISGVDIMQQLNLKPGPEVGKILTDLFAKVENKQIKNTKKDLLKELKTLNQQTV